MLGVELDLAMWSLASNGLLSILQEQGLLLYVAVSYLLNVEHVRIAPSFTHGTVLRIEPPLIADPALCDRLIGAMRRLLDVLQRGDSGQLLGHLMGRSGFHAPSQFNAPGPDLHSRSAIATQRSGKRTRFAFIAHLLSVDDSRRFNPSLESFDDTELEALKSRITDFMKPCPLDELAVQSADGRLAEGELIICRACRRRCSALAEDEAVNLIQSAVDLGVERGAEVIGLAGFSSIVTYGDSRCRRARAWEVTSGNSYTTWSAMRAVEAACAKRAVSLANCTIAIVGATGAIGHALSLLCAERAAEVILRRQSPRRRDQYRETAIRGRGLQTARGISCRLRAHILPRHRRGAVHQAPHDGGDGYERGCDHHHRYRGAPSEGPYCPDGDECCAPFHLGTSSAKRRHGLRCLPPIQCCS